MTTDNRTVPDELLTAAIRDATATLNRALAAAYDAGLLVDIDTMGMQAIGRGVPRITVTAKVSRPL
jgi:hypothetical protein